MGVPKFFRYTSERYPCLNELVKQYQIPDFDNMYLDMNGIIHNCSHPDDSNPHFRITEEKIFQDIFHYLSILFQIIKPKKLFFMAIDGVAPRAKMNQQRGRRFRSAREAEKLEAEATEKGEVLPTEKRFDSNCITPGTVFMARLHAQLRFFVKQKMSSDPLWSNVKVILSGHETPGEGEHKIMDYIRWARSQPDYDPNTRHCLYGLDADLIMLGMCTHEPHFALLREEVKFGKTTQRATSPEETNFYLLHLSLLREYLAQEFIAIKDNLPFEYDIEKIVDDWVLMGFLVGNDFIPNLPNMHISNDALPVLYKTYMTVLPTLDGYINEAGDLNLARFEIFMEELSKIDLENFQDTFADFKFLEDKTGSRRPTARERRDLNYKPNDDETFNVNVDEIKKVSNTDDELEKLINRTNDMLRPQRDEASANTMGDGNRMDDDNKMDDMDEKDLDPSDGYEESDEELTMEEEFVLHKKDYYTTKLSYTQVTEEVLASQAEGYVRAIQWNLYYYYKGCPSWCWYYPHHYAPYISDIKGFKDLKIEFELGEPFKPFEQLLAVLPAASKQLLPMPFHDLMTHDQSPIVHYYPVKFDTDLNGKRNDWEAVVLIPFINEVNLLSAMEPCYQRLTEEEKKRNQHGPMLVYNWTSQDLGPVNAPDFFAPIAECHAIEKFVWREELEVPESMLKRGMLPNAKRDMLFPGFPTMRHLKYRTSLKKGKVKVFDQQSRNENMIVEIIRDNDKQIVLEDVAKEVLGKVIWVGWPHLTKAKIMSVSNEQIRLHFVDNRNNSLNYTTEVNAGNLQKQWIGERSTIIEHNMNRLGIELGDVKIILHAANLRGYKYIIQNDVRMVQEPEWCTVQCGYAHQAVVQDVSAHIVQEGGKFSTPQEAYPPGHKVVMLTNGKHYGAIATVVDSDIKSGRIKVTLMERDELIVRAHTIPSSYRSANHAAAACGISTQLLSRVTGTLLVVAGKRNDLPTENVNKHNIGLNLKFNKKNLEVAGYTRRSKSGPFWSYSERCIELVKSYAKQYPDLFDNLAHLNRDVYFESDLFPDELGKNKVQEVSAWLKSQPHTSAARRECGSECLEPEEMLAIARGLRAQRAGRAAGERRTLQVKWTLLYKPELHSGNLQPDPKADYQLYDRVVCVANNMTVPMGLTGTITAIYMPGNANTVRLSDKLNAEPTYQVMFDESFPGAMSEDLFDEPMFYRMSSSMLVNISFGRKLRSSVMSDPPDPYALPSTNTPFNLLRPNDGHNSAFANYSPPGERTTFGSESRNEASSTARAKTPPQDSASTLLKSLLKISENEPPPKKSEAKTKTATPEQKSNWRVKTETSPNSQPTHSQRSASGAPPTNWRTETAAAPPAPPPANSNRQPPLFNQEWMNNTYKNQPLVPPYPPPVYGQPFQGPGPNQIPFPQFSNPHFQQRSNQPSNQPFAYGVRQPDHTPYNQGPPPPRFPDQGFPKHLPSVSTNVTLGPSWHQPNNQSRLQNAMPPPQAAMPPPQAMNMAYQQQNAPPSNPNLDRSNNPFVPLQVQTRRTQPSGSSRREVGQNQAQRAALPRPQPINAPMAQQAQNPTSRPIRKKKPRIAADLPFDEE